MFTEAAEECKQCDQLRLFILCEVGGIHFIKLDWRAAALAFEKFLEGTIFFSFFSFLLFFVVFLSLLSFFLFTLIFFYWLESTTIGMRALIHYQLGVCYAMLFHDEDAKRNMETVFNYVRKVSSKIPF